MTEPAKSSITTPWGNLPNPCVRRTRPHALHDIPVIALCRVTRGADDWVRCEPV